MAKIDPGLKRIVKHVIACRKCGPTERAPLAPRGLDKEATPNIMIELEGDKIPKELVDLGFVKRTQAGRVLTGQIPREGIEKLEGMAGLKRAEAPRQLVRDLDKALPDAHLFPTASAPPQGRGRGVIIGIVDHGIDFRHLSFRKDDAAGSTRILALWDQSLTPVAGETSPDPFGYGVEYDATQINAALASASSTSVRHLDLAPFHGTHVAGIAAGGGRPVDPITGAHLFGVAPGADLVIVANTRSRRLDPGTVGDSADTLDAIHYILEVAKAHSRPVVINLSQGDNVGPHDGTSLLELGIAELIAGPGRVLIKSAGNEGDGASHAQGTLTGASKDVQITVPEGEVELVIDLWYPSADRIALTVVPPGGGPVGPFAGPDSTVTLANGNELFVDPDLNDPGNGQNRIYLAVEVGSAAKLQAGTWTLRLTGAGDWHAWIQRDSGSTFDPEFANAASTITVPGTAASAITVGAHVSRSLLHHGKLSKISSRGPTRAGVMAPTLTAPGESIIAAQPGDGFVPQKGTSMAAAMVSGAAALMLAIDGTLTAKDIKEILEKTARKDLHTGLKASNEWGHGKLDIEDACEMVESSRRDRAAHRDTRSGRTPVVDPLPVEL